MARYRRLSLAVLLAVCLLLFHHSVGQARASKDGIGAHRVLDRGMQIIRRSSSGKRAPSTASALASYGGHGKASLVRRQQFITDEDRANPVQAAKDVQAIPFLAGNASGITDTAHQLVPGDSDEGQLPWNNGTVPFIATPDTTASAAGGWQAIPDLQGFTLNRSWEVVPGAVMPFYITAGVDPTQVKRAVITFPGKPRDSWKYANLYRNALSVVYANETYGVTNNSVLIVSPVWMNEIDQQAGGVQGKEVYFHGSEWEAGGASRGPNLTHSLTTYGLMDNFTDMLFDTNQYPNLNQVVVAGHSMGGQAAHRYAVLKKQKKYDDNMSFWVGNPGSWTYLSSERPYNNASCTATFDNWHYGIGGNVTKVSKYARKDVQANKAAVVNRYLARKIHMALGLLDNGAGDTHCEARDQGGSHLDRGSQYVLHLANVNNGNFPSSQTVDFIGNTSHQDFAMISANESIYWLFVNDYNTRYPDITPSNPGDKTPNATHVPKPKSYATHGNEALASGLLGGSLLLIILIFSIAPFLFRANFDEDAFNASVARAGKALGAPKPFLGSMASAPPYDMSTIDSSTPLTQSMADYDLYPPKPRWATQGR